MLEICTMATTELKASIESLKNNEIKPSLAQIMSEITKRYDIITKLENKVEQLEDRMNECMREVFIKIHHYICESTFKNGW